MKAVKKLAELTSMKLIIDETLDLSKWEKNDAEIPLRNLLFAQVASLYGAKRIWLALQKGETQNPSNDRSPEFCTRTSDMLSAQYNTRVMVTSPFWHLTKQDIVKWYKSSGLPLSYLYETVSCFSSSDEDILTHCGRCSACFRKWVALSYNDLWDENLNLFISDPRKWEGIEVYKNRLKNGFYEPERTRQTIYVLKKWNLW